MNISHSLSNNFKYIDLEKPYYLTYHIDSLKSILKFNNKNLSKVYKMRGKTVFLLFLKFLCNYWFKQHHLETRHAHRNVAKSQMSEVVGRVPKNYNSYPDAIFK